MSFVLSALLRQRLGAVEIINFDEETNLVMSKRKTSTGDEFMIHKFYPNDKEPFNSALESGSYLSTFESACSAWLERKQVKVQIEVPVSEEDLSDLQNGEEFNWTFESNKGINVDVILKSE